VAPLKRILIVRAAAVESNSEHFLAKAIVAAAGHRNRTRLAVTILRRLLVEERRRSFAFEQSERRGTPYNHEEFGLERGRNCLNLGREVLSDLREMRIKDPNDCGWKLLEFV
jgi:hypothetical protein